MYMYSVAAWYIYYYDTDNRGKAPPSYIYVVTTYCITGSHTMKGADRAILREEP